MSWGPAMDPPPFQLEEALSERLGPAWEILGLLWWDTELDGQLWYRVTYKLELHGEYVYGRAMLRDRMLRCFKHPEKILEGIIRRQCHRMANPDEYRVQQWQNDEHDTYTAGGHTDG